MYENLKNSDNKLEVEKENLKDLESVLHKVEYKEWKEVTTYLLTFHVNFKDDVYDLNEFNIGTKYDLALINQDDSILKYKERYKTIFWIVNTSFLNI